MKYSRLTLLLIMLTVAVFPAVLASTPKKHHMKHRSLVGSPIIQRTVINNYGLINNGVVQKTQQSSTAINNTQDNSSHQDYSTRQTLTQTQINTLNQTQVNSQVNALNQTQFNGIPFTGAPSPAEHLRSFSSVWSTNDGNQYMETNGSDLHLKPRTEGTGPHTVTATSNFSASETKNWQLSFDIRFGALRDQASSFHIKRDGHDIGWIGADGFSNQIGVFIGNDSEIYALSADTQWHHVSFMNDSNNLTVGLDGKQIGSGAPQNAPQSVALLNNQDMTVSCHQEGVWLRNVQVQPMN